MAAVQNDTESHLAKQIKPTTPFRYFIHFEQTRATNLANAWNAFEIVMNIADFWLVCWVNM